MHKRWRLIGGLILVAFFLVLALPYTLSAYHLHAGGQALEEALGRHDPLEWWYIGPRSVQDPRALDAAIEHLDKAHRAPYAQRLLGQAYVARGDTLRGVLALEQFVEKRPKHYLAQLELAAAYIYADARLHELEYLDLLAHVEGAWVSAPDQETPVAYTHENWQSGYVYPTAFSLPPEYGNRSTLFVHAGSAVTWTVPLTLPSVLRFAMGQAPRSLGWGGDGATFEVLVNGERAFLEHLPVDQARKGWHEREVDLSAYTGQTIHLSLATTPGPAGDVTGDWAGWGEPRLEDAQASAYRQTVKTQPWRAKWNEMGVQAKDWIEAGEVARQAQQYETAWAWYDWAERLSAGKGDVWYYRGLLYEDQQRWADALAAFRRANEIGHLQTVPPSSIHYRLGMLNHRRLNPPRLEEALAAYDAALETNDFDTVGEAADCHYWRGEALRGLDASPDEYTEAFREALELDTRHVWAHIALGIAAYKEYQDAEQAESEFKQALELAPRTKWAYYYLGEVYWTQARTAEALEMYERALEIDSEFRPARERLTKIDREN